MTGKIKYFEGNIIFIQSSNKIIPVFAVFDQGQQYFPIVVGYASTVHKVMGQTLQHVTLAFDIRILSPAVGYVALSRVSAIDNVVPLLRLRKSHFINIVHWCYSQLCLVYSMLLYLQTMSNLLSTLMLLITRLHMICATYTNL